MVETVIELAEISSIRQHVASGGPGSNQSNPIYFILLKHSYILYGLSIKKSVQNSKGAKIINFRIFNG